MIYNAVNTLANIHLQEHHVYRFGNLLVEATYRRGWTLMVLTENGNHIARQHDALVAFRMRDDGLWEPVFDRASRNLFGWRKWSVSYGEPVVISFSQLEHIAQSRYAVEEELQQREIDRTFREIMAGMDW
jgi:hypothetical protein